MNIHGPQFNPRIDPISDRPDDQGEEGRKRRRVKFHGRTWGQKEENDLAVDTAKMSVPSMQDSKEYSKGVYSDRISLDEAQQMFDRLTTLEEKIAQLCFYQTQAVYDTALQNEIEILIQAWQIGGVLFTGGEYKRQAYLIERFQLISKTPLLMGNDFLHGLSFYYDDQPLPTFEGGLSEQRFSDLGKAVMVLGRRMNVHFQLDKERKVHHIPMTEHHARAFRKGIRQAHGIVARTQPAKSNYSASSKHAYPIFSVDSPLAFSKDSAQEHIGVKSLNFLDLTGEEITEKRMIEAFREHYEIFLCSGNIQKVITTIAGAVRNGKIWEKHIDRLVMKLLVLKSLFKY